MRLDRDTSESTILVTGAAGQLGSELRDLAEMYPSLHFRFFDRTDLPLDRPDLLAKVFEDLRPLVCLNAAAYTAVDKAESDAVHAFAINAEAVGDLAILCKLWGSLLIHISTDYVFDGQGKEPYREVDPTSPLGVYGASKLLGEKLAFNTYERVLVIRTSWVYSAYGKNFVKTMLRLMGEKESLGVVDDQHGRPTYAADLASAILDICALYQTVPFDVRRNDARFRGIYHYADEGAITWYDFARAIASLSGSSCEINPIPTSAYPTPARRPAYSVLDTNRIEATFRLRIPDWKESLRRCLEKLK
jgi:dTDP-4-dehydrorhamnose reductase